MSSNQAFEEGYDAYWARLDKDDNPYPPGTPERRSWDEGWSQAELEDNEEAAEPGA